MATRAPAQPVSQLSSAHTRPRGTQLGSQVNSQLASGSTPGLAPGAAREGGSSPADPVQARVGADTSNPVDSQTHLVATAGGTGHAAGNAMPPTEDAGYLRLSAPHARLPVALEVMVPVREFRVHHLLAMTLGDVIETRWGHGEDLPLSTGEVQLAWSEFEVVDSRLAVRVTRLA